MDCVATGSGWNGGRTDNASFYLSSFVGCVMTDLGRIDLVSVGTFLVARKGTV